MLFLATLIAGVFLSRFLERIGTEHLREQGESIIEAMAVGVHNELASSRAAAGAMAGSPWIFPAFLDPDPANIKNANSVLDRYNSQLDFSVCYLLDLQGNAIASSNRAAPDSFVGKNYAFRPYFQEASRGTPSVFIGTGITSHERGFYAAHPVLDGEKKIVGVAVIKKNVDAVKGILAGQAHSFLISPEGVIFISGSREMLFKTLWPLTREQILGIEDSRQFHGVSFEPVFSVPVQAGMKIRFRGEIFESFRKPLGPPGWSLVLLESRRSVLHFSILGWVITAFMASSVLMLTLWASWRVKGQELLRRSEESLRKFQRAIEQSPAMVVITDLKGAIEYVNPKFTEICGYAREEVLGKNPRILKSGELPDEAYKELWEAIISGKEWRGEFHNKKKNGDLYWEFASISPIRDAQGMITHFLAVKEDITERKQMERALGESEKKFRSLVANIPGIVYRCKMDLDWTMLYLSEEVDRISGYPAADFINNSVRSYESVIFKEDAAFVERSIRDAVAVGKHWGIEYRVIHKDGLVRWVYEKGRGVTDEAGAVQYLDGFILDISDRKRAEEIIIGKTRELELQSWGLQKANDGIKALYQELEQKNVDLEKLNRLKDDFVSIVAHELRNPLGVVREAASLILDGLVGPVEEEQKKYLEIIKRTGDRLIRITTDLLDLAKIEAGKIVVNFERIDLLSVARQACEGIALRTNKKGLTVSQVLPEGKLEISADFDKLTQVMSNLLSNAFKFTEKGGITVEVKDLGEEVRCAVEDTGPGISKENLSRLFSKFEQFGKPTTTAEKGSGLGLVISKSIIEAHGGRIWAESEPGKGSSFIFTLPKQHRQKKLGEILVEEKALTPEQLANALRKQNGQKS